MSRTPSQTFIARSWKNAAAMLLVLALFLGAGFAIYWPAMGGEFIWDDAFLVKGNPFAHSPVFALEVFRHHLFFDSASTYYRPVQNWSYIFDYWLWHGAPVGYHVTNIVVHSLSAFLLFVLLRQLLPPLADFSSAGKNSSLRQWLPLLVAAVWLVHPIHNAAVAYIAGRADSLASLFALVSWLLVQRAQAARGAGLRIVLSVAAAVAMLLALCSKEIALVWLGLLVMHALFFSPKNSRSQKITLLGGALFVLGVYAILHALPAPRHPPAVVAAPFSERILTMLRALGDYTSLIFFPDRLTMERRVTSPAMYRDAATWIANLRPEYLSLLGTLTFAAFLMFTTRGVEKRLRAFGVCWFLFGFLPISNLIPLNAEVAEHWIYLASIGYLIFIAACLLPHATRAPRLSIALCACALTALGVRTWIRAGDWANEERFLKSTIASGGGSPRVLNNLAGIYGARGDAKTEEYWLREAVRAFPEFPVSRINLQINLAHQGRTAEAQALIEASNPQTAAVAGRESKPWKTRLIEARLHHDAGQNSEALAILEDTRKSAPEAWEIIALEAEILRAQPGANAALPLVEAFAAAHWWHRESWLLLGQLRFAAKDCDGAIAAFRHASRCDIYDTKSLGAIAEIEAERGHSAAALDAQIAAISREPRSPHSYVALAGLLEKIGQPADAEAALRKAQILAARSSAL